MPVILGVTKDEEDQYILYLQVPIPLRDSISTQIVKGKGNTINHAIDSISADMESSVDLLHVKVIVIEKKLAEEGVKDFISSIMRSREISPKALVTISEDDLDSFFEKMKNSTEPEGTSLYDYFEKNAGWSPQIAQTRVWQLYRSIHSYTRDVPIPLLKAGKSTLVNLIGSAVIKNGKMVEQMNPDETLLYNAFEGQSTSGKIEVMDTASVMILNNKLLYDSSLIGETPHLKCTLKLKVMILETIGNPTLDEIRKDLNKMMTDRFNHLFAKLQESEADILGLGQYFRRQIPRNELKHWRSKYYPDLLIDFKVQTDIQNTGNLKTPL